MRADIKTTNHFILDLTEEEAIWLRDIMQNPLHVHPNDEDDKDKEMRYKFFSAVEKAGRIS